MEKARIPNAISTGSFIAARVAEIEALANQIADCDHGKRVFQTLPRHMRRRQVSSNPKRLPNYLRDKHKREQGKTTARVSRRPSRKHRRRPRNLLEEYNRRQKDHVWLETHIWHAKRFHMIKRWGYTLPDSCTSKGYRSSIRAAKKTCLTQDVSYISCIELEGELSLLLGGLSRITQSSCLAALRHQKVMQGLKWEVITLFKPGMQPYGALGDVDVHWLPSSSSSDDSKNVKLWIWVHPSAHGHIVEALTDVYDLKKMENNPQVIPNKEEETGSQDHSIDYENEEDSGECDREEDSDGTQTNVGEKKRKNESKDSKRDNKRFKDVNGMKLAKRNIPFERTPKYCSESMQVSMTLLKDTLARIRLTGPESLNVLKAALRPANVNQSESSNVNMSKEDLNKAWWMDYYGDETKMKWHQNQVKCWEKLSSSHLEGRKVLPVTVRDPRATLPKKKTPINANKENNNLPENLVWPENSPIYISTLRDRISLCKEPDAKINSLRSELLVPGSDMPEIAEESKVPLLVLSRPCTHSLGFGGGLDVVVCAGWGTNLFQTLVMNGGVAGGQQAAENLYMEFLTPQTPNLFPDTPAGDYYSTVIKQERRAEYFKRPPACRNNFIKLGVQYPFNTPWQRLAQEWVVGSENVFALRNPELLKYLASKFGNAFEPIRRKSAKPKQDDDTTSIASSVDLAVTEGSEELEDCKVSRRDSQSYSRTSWLESSENDIKELTKCGCLVKVKLILEGKGSLESCAMICMPLTKDLEENENENPYGMTAGTITEPPHEDMQQEARETLKREHNHVRAKIHRMRAKTKQNLEKEVSASGMFQRGEAFKKKQKSALDRLSEENQVLFTKHQTYNSTMEDLWLMKEEIPFQCCSRNIMGYITQGTFSMTIGRGAGIGWVALKPLFDCLKLNNDSHTGTDSNLVLVRNPSNSVYFKARLYVVTC